MKKTLMIIGSVFLLLVVVAGGLVGYAFVTGSGLDRSSKNYVDESVNAIATSWSKDELLKRSSPQLLEALNKNPGETERLFAKFAEIGSLKSYEGSKGDANVYVDVAKGKFITASYVASATFTNGKAKISVRLIQSGGQWRIVFFHVDSPFFLK